MKNYIYKLKDQSGQNLYGFMEAHHEKDLKRKLRDNRYYFISATVSTKSAIFKRKATLETLLMFTRRLSSLIEAGVPILPATNILWRQTEDITMQLVISHMRQNLEEGKNISVAFKDFPKIFPLLYSSMISVAERAGGLVLILNKLTSYLEYQKNMITRTKKATFYPMLVIGFSTLVLMGMFTFVVPTFTRVLIKLKVELPFITKVVISISSFIRSWPFMVLLVLGVVGGYMAYRLMRNSPKFAYTVDKYKLKIPIIGPILYTLSLSRFVHSMAILLSAGLPVVESFEVAKSTTYNRNIIESIEIVKDKVERGGSLYESFKDAPDFPIMLIEMVGVGEASGKIVPILENLTKHFDEEVEYKQNKLLTLLEPALIIVVGFIVIITLLAVYMPIFSIWQNLVG